MYYGISISEDYKRYYILLDDFYKTDLHTPVNSNCTNGSFLLKYLLRFHSLWKDQGVFLKLAQRTSIHSKRQTTQGYFSFKIF